MLRTIVERARQGDEEAFAALVREVGDRCIFIAHRILRDGNLAEDAVQVALVQVWRELPALRDLDRFEAWLHRILVNACYAEARRGRHYAVDVVLLETDAPAGADDYLTVHDRDQLDRGFRRLPPDQRAVLVFHYALGLTVPEVADHLGHGEPEGVVEDEDGALLRRKSPEAAVQLVTVVDCQELRPRRPVGASVSAGRHRPRSAGHVALRRSRR